MAESDDDPRLQWKREIGARLREERQRRHLSQTDLAKRFSYTKQLISHWETGRSEIASYDLWLLKPMGFDIYYILMNKRVGGATTTGASTAQPERVAELEVENAKLKKLLAVELLAKALRDPQA